MFKDQIVYIKNRKHNFSRKFEREQEVGKEQKPNNGVEI